MRAHVIVAAVTLAAVLLICAAAGPLDRGKGLNYPNLRGAAKYQALQP